MELINAIVVALNIFCLIVIPMIVIGEGYKTRHPPVSDDRTFGDIIAANKRFREIAVPALLTFVAGVLGNISASFLFRGGQDDHDSQVNVGFALAVITASALIAGLVWLFDRPEKPSAFAKNPFDIQKAAEQYASDPLSPEISLLTLRNNLEEWKKCRVGRALGYYGPRVGKKVEQHFLRLEKLKNDVVVAPDIKNNLEKNGWRIFLERFVFSFCAFLDFFFHFFLAWLVGTLLIADVICLFFSIVYGVGLSVSFLIVCFGTLIALGILYCIFLEKRAETWVEAYDEACDRSEISLARARRARRKVPLKTMKDTEKYFVKRRNTKKYPYF